MSEPARILVIDDDDNVRRILEMILEASGYIVDTARNGKEAIEKSNTSFYNLALVDIRLPDMNGTNLLTAMRVTTPKMIKIIVTGYLSLENDIEAVSKEADGYVVKPFKTEQLLSMIEERLQKQREAQQHSEQKTAEESDVSVGEETE
jgi:DNA-binding NtrC family response regulator